jgi:hypothetical protein
MVNIFRYTYNVIYHNKWSDNEYFRNLVIFSFAIIIYYVYKKYVDDTDDIYEVEGFSQNNNYIYKKNESCYDDFYLEMYDTIYNHYITIPEEMESIIKNTQINEKSRILILNPITGIMVNEFQKYNYNCSGLDNIRNNVKYSKTLYPNIYVEHGNLLDPLIVNDNSLSHIILSNYNLYKYQDKYSLFKNCNYWLNSNGYFIVHLIDPDQFDTIIPVAKPCIYNNVQKAIHNRIKKCKVDFLGFNYKSEYIFNDDNNLILKETFVDKKTNHTRQQEKIFFLESINKIEEIAKKSGFLLHSKINMKEINGDSNQFLYFFEKIN